MEGGRAAAETPCPAQSEHGKCRLLGDAERAGELFAHSLCAFEHRYRPQAIQSPESLIACNLLCIYTCCSGARRYTRSACENLWAATAAPGTASAVEILLLFPVPAGLLRRCCTPHPRHTDRGCKPARRRGVAVAGSRLTGDACTRAAEPPEREETLPGATVLAVALKRPARGVLEVLAPVGRFGRAPTSARALRVAKGLDLDLKKPHPSHDNMRTSRHAA